MAGMSKYQKAIIHLLSGDGIFYASLLMQCRLTDGKNLPEGALAAVSVQNGRIHLHIDPARLESLSVEQVSRILEHECLHLILEHLNRTEGRHPYVWNIATDLAINSLINGMDMGLLCGKEPFTDLPPKKSADFYYAVIRDKYHAGEVTFHPDGTITVKDGKTGKTVTLKPTGDHSEWDKVSSVDNGLMREVIKQAVAEAAAQAKAAGKWPSGIEELVKELLDKETVNWKRLLRQYIGNKVKAGSKHTWKRESKRFGVLQKGKTKTRMIKIGIAIDTSGSVSADEFQEFMSEIYGLMNSYKTNIQIVECDAKIQKAYTLKKYAKIDTKFKGRGGTDFRPVFEHFVEGDGKHSGIEMLIFFTDLEGPFPEMEPRTFRTLWVRTSQGYATTAPFGKVICIPKRQGGD